MQYMFGFPVIVLIPLALNKISNKRIRILLSSVICICYFLYGYKHIASGDHDVLPYKSVL